MVGKMTEDKSGSDRWCIDNESDYVQHERKQSVMGSEGRVLIPHASAEALSQHDDKKGNEMGAQFYMLPVGIKPAISMLIAFGVGACVLGASINEGMRGHAFTVETPVAGNSSASLWKLYPSVTQSCVHALHACEAECYQEEMKCYQNKSQGSCPDKRKLCLGTQGSSLQQQSCLALQQECERTALCFQGHQFCHTTGCFDTYMSEGGAGAAFQRAARSVWTVKAKAYDACVHSDVVSESVKGGANLKSTHIMHRRLAPSGCSHDMEKCLEHGWEANLEQNLNLPEFEPKAVALGDNSNSQPPTKVDVYMKDSCGTQEAKCRAQCYDGHQYGLVSKLNLVVETVENTGLVCESQCAKIGSICSGFQNCSAAYQTCFFTNCAPQKGGPYKYDPDPANHIPTWSFATDGKAYVECTNGCLRSLEICFQSVEWACKPDAQNMYCELPPSLPVTPK